MVRKYIFGITGIVIILLFLGLLNNVIPSDDEQIVVYFPNTADFPNPKESTVVYDFSLPKSTFRVGERDADMLVFMDSSTVPGLKVGYDSKNKKIFGGLPPIYSEEINIMDGLPHNLAYTFSAERELQAIYLDQAVVAQGQFTGKVIQDAVTGYVGYKNVKLVESPVEIQVRFE